MTTESIDDRYRADARRTLELLRVDPAGGVLATVRLAESLLLPATTRGVLVLGTAVRDRVGRAGEVWHLPTRDIHARYAYPGDARLATAMSPAMCAVLLKHWFAAASRWEGETRQQRQAWEVSWDATVRECRQFVTGLLTGLGGGE